MAVKRQRVERLFTRINGLHCYEEFESRLKPFQMVPFRDSVFSTVQPKDGVGSFTEGSFNQPTTSITTSRRPYSTRGEEALSCTDDRAK